MLDTLDYKILKTLSEHGRISWSDLAQLLKLSAPSTADRVKRLEEKGFIKSYHASLDYFELGYTIVAFIAVTLAHPKHQKTFLKRIMQLAEIEECHHVAGEDDYLLKVRCLNTDDLNLFLTEKLKVIMGVAKTKTTIVLSTVKDEVKKI